MPILPRVLLAAAPVALLFAAPSAAQGLPPVPSVPGNPVTNEKALLGKALFWEEQLSSTRTVACGTCHVPSAGGSDPRALEASSANPGHDGVFGTFDDVRGSAGVVRNDASGDYLHDALFGLRPRTTGRKSPTMINAAFSPELFWDGRAGGAFVDPVSGSVALAKRAALESQAAGPPVSDVEMGHDGRDWLDVLDRLANVEPLALASDVPAELEAWIAGRGYPDLFLEAFGSSTITASRVLMAIATYERTLISDQTPFDAMLAGDLTQLSAREIRGMIVFNGPGLCSRCHSGALTTDQSYHNIGVRPVAEDVGRQAVTGLAEDRGKFKTPDLRNVALRAPYFHNGSQQNLAGVVAFYDRGGDHPENLDRLIRPLILTGNQQADLVAFLEGAFTDPRVANELPPFDRPTLFSESARRPTTFGDATPGSGGFAPEMVLFEPALLGNPSLTIALQRGLGGAPALLCLDLVRAPVPFTVGGAETYLAFSPSLTVLSFGALNGAGAGAGWSSHTVVVPSDPALRGLSATLQWAVLDPGSAGGLAATRAADLPMF